MCIAILNIKDRLTAKTLQNCWDNNDQGAGILWNQGNKLQTYKTYKFNKLLKKYNQLRDNIHIGKIVLHFRIATSGYEKYTNLHPFLVNENLGFVHNGVISGLGDKTYSDTYYFNELLKSLPSSFIDCDSTKELISGYIGSSKLIFLDSSDNHTIINENLGNWIDGNWYSNDSYSCSLDYYYYGNEKVNKSNSDYSDYSDYWDNWDNKTYSPEKIANENINYFRDYWKNSDEFTINKVLTFTGISLDDKELWYTFESLNCQYGTNDLSKLLRLLQDEIECEYYN